MINHFKPKYKICYQTKRKIWFYKNSRLRNFYNYRRKYVVKKGKFYKQYFLKSKNIKWTVARRFMSFRRRRKKFYYNRFNYKQMFFMKQQVRKFYGKLQEFKLQRLFKNNWYLNHKWRQNNFFYALEQRLDVILYRTRFLPTIFACHQYISHNGLLVNNNLVTIPHTKLKLGDIVSISDKHWFLFKALLFTKMINRFLGFRINYRRNSRSLIRRLLLIKYKTNYIRRRFFPKFYMYRKFIYQKNNIFFKNNLIDKKSKFNIFNYWVKKKRYWNVKKRSYKNLWIHNQAFIKRTYRFYRNVEASKVRLNIGKYIMNKKNIQKNLLENNINKDIKNIKKEYDLLFNINNNTEIENRVKGRLFLSLKYIKKRYFRYIKLKNKNVLKNKKKYSNWVNKPFFYVPSYMDFDFNTLRVGFINIPSYKDIHYGFECSLDKLISYYKDKAI